MHQCGRQFALLCFSSQMVYNVLTINCCLWLCENSSVMFVVNCLYTFTYLSFFFGFSFQWIQSDPVTLMKFSNYVNVLTTNTSTTHISNTLFNFVIVITLEPTKFQRKICMDSLTGLILPNKKLYCAINTNETFNWINLAVNRLITNW